MKKHEALGKYWEENTQVLRNFIELCPLFTKLAEEVAYVLEKTVNTENIEYSAIIHRTKTLDSFCEKATRKKYEDPLKQTSDIAGVRIVYLYISELPLIEKTIETNFVVVDKIDKVADSEDNVFGYGAVHYIVRLGEKLSGARYDELKNFVCEIQVRTILQDAWALVGHHLSYKQESDVPKPLRRKLNALAGLFETADDQFNQLRAEQLKYREDMIHIFKKPERKKDAKQDLNIDNLSAYLDWKLPEREMESGDTGELLLELVEAGYKTIVQLDEIIEKASAAVCAYEEANPPTEIFSQEPTKYTRTGFVRTALKFIDREYAMKNDAPLYAKMVRNYGHLIK